MAERLRGGSGAWSFIWSHNDQFSLFPFLSFAYIIYDTFLQNSHILPILVNRVKNISFVEKKKNWDLLRRLLNDTHKFLNDSPHAWTFYPINFNALFGKKYSLAECLWIPNLDTLFLSVWNQTTQYVRWLFYTKMTWLLMQILFPLLLFI